MVDFKVGDTVTFAVTAVGHSAAGYPAQHTFEQGSQAEVTRVNKNRITVQTETTRTWESYYGQEERSTGMYSYNVDRVALEAPNGEAWSTPAPARKVGEVPEGMIAPDDPRLDWLWKDAEKVANYAGYCNQYDYMAEKLGIPGRERDFRVDHTINGIKVSAVVKARSLKEAKATLKEKLGADK